MKTMRVTDVKLCVQFNRWRVLMLPHEVFYLVPVLMLTIFFGSFFLNIRRAKKRVAHWKGYSTWLFFRSNGAALSKRAKSIWMKEEGYDEAEALIIAGFQARAVICTIFGIVLLFAFAANVIEPMHYSKTDPAPVRSEKRR
jgi:hypothetical protein